MKQVFQGLQYLHERYIVHRLYLHYNLMFVSLKNYAAGIFKDFDP